MKVKISNEMFYSSLIIDLAPISFPHKYNPKLLLYLFFLLNIQQNSTKKKKLDSYIDSRNLRTKEAIFKLAQLNQKKVMQFDYVTSCYLYMDSSIICQTIEFRKNKKTRASDNVKRNSVYI